MSELNGREKASLAVKKGPWGRSVFPNQFCWSPNLSGGVLNGSLASAVASHTPVSMVTQALRLLSLNSPSSPALPSTLHLWQRLSMTCRGKPALPQWVLNQINYHWTEKLVHLRNPNLPQFLQQSCQLLVSSFGSRSCLRYQGFQMDAALSWGKEFYSEKTWEWEPVSSICVRLCKK